MGFGPFDKKVLPDHPKVNMEFLPFKRLDLHKNNESSNIFSPISRQNLSRAKIVAKWMTKVVIEFCEKEPDSYLPIFPMWVQSLKYHVNFSVCLITLWEWCAYGSWPHMEIILLFFTFADQLIWPMYVNKQLSLYSRQLLTWQHSHFFLWWCFGFEGRSEDQISMERLEWRESRSRLYD